VGWAVGYDENWKRDVGYGVPAICDHPGCGEEINRGLGYVCGDQPFGGEHGCGLFFCSKHRHHRLVDPDDDDGDVAMFCERCPGGEPFEPTPDTDEWTHHKMTDPSWAEWRAVNLTAETKCNHPEPGVDWTGQFGKCRACGEILDNGVPMGAPTLDERVAELERRVNALQRSVDAGLPWGAGR